MLKKVKSLITLVVIFFQKVYDHFYRLIKGIPTIKRSQITADLFLGSQYNKVGMRKLKALGITAIVNMRIHSIYRKAQYKGFEYRHFPTIDNTAPSLEVLIKGAQFIDEQIKKNGKVYVHCRQGLGRGPTMAIAYLLKSGLTFEDALGLVKKVRPFINPRRSQITRLKELEQFYNAQVI